MADEKAQYGTPESDALILLIATEINRESIEYSEQIQRNHPRVEAREALTLLPKSMCISATALAKRTYGKFIDDLDVAAMAAAISVSYELDGQPVSADELDFLPRADRERYARQRAFVSASDWRSHLFPILSDKDGGNVLIVDSTIAQYGAPEKDMFLPDSALIRPAGSSAVFEYPQEHAPERVIRVQYDFEPDNTRYSTTRHWTANRLHRSANRVIDAVRRQS